jgi:hypothetical protein
MTTKRDPKAHFDKVTLSQERLKQALSYDPETGVFTWLISSGRVRAGQRAGVASKGYWMISVDKRIYKGHRLAFLYIHGFIPRLIDHINRDGLDNRIVNLRECTQSQNIINSKGWKNSSSGHTGVQKERDKWKATIKKDGKHIRIGVFFTIEEARAARKKKELELFGEFSP